MINLFKQKLILNDFIRSVSVLVSGTVISQTAIVLITPVLTRLYGPEAFGLYAIYTAILYTVTIISSLHYETAIPLAKNDKDAINTLALALLVLLGFVFIGIFLIILLNVIPYDNKNMAFYWLFLPLSIFGLGSFQVFQLWALRTESYRYIAQGRVQMNMSQMLIQVSLGMTSRSGSLLIAGDALGRVVGGFGLAYFFRQDFSRLRAVISRKRMKNMAIRYKKFPLISSWSSIFSGLSTHLPTFFIAGMIGIKAAGLYLIASRILALPDALFGNAVKQVYIAKGAKLLQNSFPQFRKLFKTTIQKLILLSLSIFTFVFILAPFLLPIVFGESWEETGTFVQCMVILYASQLIITPITANFYLLELLHLQVIAELGRLLFLILGIGYAYLFLQEPWQIILCISIAGAIGTIMLGLFSWYSLISFYRQDTIQINKLSK